MGEDGILPADVKGRGSMKTPELSMSLQLQAKAFKEGRKPAVLFLARDSGMYLPGQWFISIDQGDVVYDSEETLSLIKNGDLGFALGYGINKKVKGGKTISAYDKEGNLVIDIVTDGSKTVEDAALKIAGEGGYFVERTPQEVLNERRNQ